MTVYNFGSGRVVSEVRGKSLPHLVAFSPDGRFLAIGGTIPTAGPFEPDAPDFWHGEVGLWDVTTGKCLSKTRIREKGAAILALAFSPHGKKLATGDISGNIRIWAVPEHLWPERK